MEINDMKRKASEDLEGSQPKKKGRNQASTEEAPRSWPPYFEHLYKTFKALNTVIAFCSSRKHLATTFPVVRKSVENLLKRPSRPLDLGDVAEIKAIIPELLRFGYIPADQVKINPSEEPKTKRGTSPSYALPSGPLLDEDEHVLILEFVESTKKTRSAEQENAYSLPPSMTAAALKKLIEQRNNRFVQAVNELIEACPEGEDASELVKQASRDHIPITPGRKDSSSVTNAITFRPPMPQIIEELKSEEWYRGQIVEHRSFEKKEVQFGELSVPLADSIAEGLQKARSITNFYSHQAAAINAISERKNVIVSTATASGKSVIYQVPVLR
ncbi:hypothetical protein M408DRAFT_11334, partial [Serendipita vermifera MAFF 305830]